MATILVVDDKDANRMLLTTLLSYGGHRLLEAANGFDGLSKAQVEHPQLIITDILMPGMDGYEFVRRVRSLPIAPQPEIIFHSATYLEGEALALARACGVSRIIAKPVQAQRVLEVVKEALAAKGPPQPVDSGSANSQSDAIRVLSDKLYRKVEELEQLNCELENRVEQRTSELERMNRSLQQQVLERQKAEAEAAQSNEERLKMKGEFLSHVSHELRSPLGVVHQFVTILLDGLAGCLNADQREYLEIALRNVNQLKGMIDDLLEASRADLGKLTILRFSIQLQELLNDTVATHQTIAAKKKIALKCELAADLPPVYADAGRVSQVLTNLLDNAVKFSSRETVITVRAVCFTEDPNFLCISVADQGCGIGLEDVERIFDRLYQAHGADEAGRRGLGLGLHICKQIVGLHGGSIWVKSEPWAGSTFFFTLPIFTIKNMIAPLLAGTGRAAPSMALLTVEVLPNPAWRNAVHRERSLHKVQQLLERCILPDLDVLLPAENWAGLDLFAVVARTDEHGAQVIQTRIREQLSRFEDVKSGAVRCTVKSQVFSLASFAKGDSQESFVSAVADYLQGLFNKYRKRSEEHEQQDTPH